MEHPADMQKKSPWKRPAFYLAIVLCLSIGFYGGVYWCFAFEKAQQTFLTISAEEAQTAGKECIQAEIAKNNPDCPWNETTVVTRSVAFNTCYLLYAETDGQPSGGIWVTETDGRAIAEPYTYEGDISGTEYGRRQSGTGLFGFLGAGPVLAVNARPLPPSNRPVR